MFHKKKKEGIKYDVLLQRHNAGVYSISPDDKCGIYVWHDCCSRTKGLRKLCRIRHKGISVLKGVCVLCFVFWLVSMFGEVISVQKVFLIKDMPYAMGMALAAVITFLIIKIFGSNYKRMKREIKKCIKFIR